MKEFDKELPDREYREAVLTGIEQSLSILSSLSNLSKNSTGRKE